MAELSVQFKDRVNATLIELQERIDFLMGRVDVLEERSQATPPSGSTSHYGQEAKGVPGTAGERDSSGIK